MRCLALIRLFALIFVALGSPVAPALVAGAPAALAGDDYGEDGEDGDDDDDDDGEDNEGHGNDDDDDNDNQGQGTDNTYVSPIADYRVDVTCEPAGDASGTTCSFTPVAPDAGKKVSHLLVPEGVACAEVVGGNGDFVDPDPNVNVTGYRFTGNGPYTLEFDGTVHIGTGTATFWVKAASGVYPATGPGLTCDAAAMLDESTPDAGKDTPPATTTGTVVIEIHTCTGATSESTGFDWFGECPIDNTEHRFFLSAVGDATTPLLAASTGTTGTASFEDLAADDYHLEDADYRWCHAESDNVNADSNVVVEAGATTTVWLFYCA